MRKEADSLRQYSTHPHQVAWIRCHVNCTVGICSELAEAVDQSLLFRLLFRKHPSLSGWRDRADQGIGTIILEHSGASEQDRLLIPVLLHLAD